VVEKEALLKFLGSQPSESGRKKSASQARDVPPFYPVVF